MDEDKNDFSKNKPKKEKDYIGISNFEQYEENPFIPNLIIPKGNKNVIIAKTDKAIMSRSTGEVQDDTLFIGVKKQLDKDQFVKVFHSHLQALFDLSKAALKVFSYIASITQYDDRIIFNLKKCQLYTGYKGSEVVYKGLAELLNAGIIARTAEHNLYFINPQTFYKGDRIVLINEYRKKKEKSAGTINQPSLWEEEG